MAANIPAKLKPIGISPFIIRAVQLEKAKPIITYWCYYWAVQQILKSQLHTADEECLQFTTNIMDKLEELKTSHADNDAIHDDVTGQAYVEQFAQETFDRALRPLKANKVTQQTASTFEAAATFFQLVNIWSQPDSETQRKIKYAKWNAARILKAIREGKDPNESNPKQEEPKREDVVSPLDPNDPEVQLIGSARPRPVTLEEVPDDGGLPQAPPTTYHLSSASEPQVSAPNSPLLSTAPAPDQVSPIAPPDVPSQEPGSYFPGAPSAGDQSPPELPSTTSMPPPGSSSHNILGAPPTIPSPGSYHPSVPPSASDVSHGSPSSPQDFYYPPSRHQPAPTPPFVPPQQHHAPPPAPQPAHHTAPKFTPAPQPLVQHYGSDNGSSGPYNNDDMAMMEAQKHAKWAISALNFEDVPTAVKELQAALAALGVR
ncbi:Vta1 like-domain-containing protein [Xylariaceae sp. FL0594]|nr:Vta1 like-domain-containing protein [Xylariaceae sp. FL0594]